MIYISPNNEYPRFVGDIAIATPNWKKGDPIPEGWTKVEQVDMPPYREGYLAYEVEPILVNGVMTQNWAERKLTAEELARKNAPKTAKAKLAELGFTEDEIQALALGLVN